MQSLPSSPLLTISRIFRIGGSKLCVWPHSSFTPYFSAALFIASHSAIEVAALAHRFDARERFTAVSLAKFRQRVGARVRGSGNLDIGQCGDRRHDLRARHAKAGHAQTENLSQILAL